MKSNEYSKSSLNNLNTDNFKIQNIDVLVLYKDIKNIHLSVLPPDGAVRVSAPLLMRKDIVRVYTISKLSWIKKQREKFKKQEREPKREFLDRESHYLFGKRYLLKIINTDSKPLIKLKQNHIEAYYSIDLSKKEIKSMFDEWYRNELYKKSEKLITQAMKTMDVSDIEFSIRKMKTRWGSYIPSKRKIWLNLELAKKPVECLEYIIYHELTHSFEKNHNQKFKSILSHYLPNWKELRKKLNKLPISHVDWEY